MAANAEIVQAMQTLTQQLNTMGDRIQVMENVGPVTTAQFDQRSRELRERNDAAVQGLEAAISQLRQRGADATPPPPSRITLISDKDDKPQHFGGEKGDHLIFRSWSKKIVNYLNGRRRGYRAVLEWARDQGQTAISNQEVFQSEWADRQDGNAILYDFWLKVLHGEALLIVEQAVDNGLEGFRLLTTTSSILKGHNMISSDITSSRTA